jgi:HAD superfamily hydrolase (TIGR01509 family)
MSDRDGLLAVLWDMDGTLVDSEKLWDVSLTELARRLGGELSAATRASMVGGSMYSTLRRMFAEVGAPATSEATAEAESWLTERTGELFSHDLRWRPGAPEALCMARAAGLATALVTSTQRGLTERALERIGRDHFDVTVCGDEVENPKPDPDPYLRAAELLGLPAWRCVAVEDSPTGSAAAEAAGCAVLVVPNDVDVPSGPGRVHRDGLVGLTAGELTEVWNSVMEIGHPYAHPAHSSAPPLHGRY